MPRGKKKDETNGNVLGACEYEAHGTECDRKAVVEINGWALCGYHKKYGPTMDVRGQTVYEDADVTAKIQEHNAGVIDRNNGAAAQAAFTPYSVLADITELCDRVEKHMKRVPKGRQVAAYLNSARLLLIDEMSSVAGETDPAQVPLPLDTASTTEDDGDTPEVEGNDQ